MFDFNYIQHKYDYQTIYIPLSVTWTLLHELGKVPNQLTPVTVPSRLAPLPCPINNRWPEDTKGNYAPLCTLAEQFLRSLGDNCLVNCHDRDPSHNYLIYLFVRLCASLLLSQYILLHTTIASKLCRYYLRLSYCIIYHSSFLASCALACQMLPVGWPLVE